MKLSCFPPAPAPFEHLWRDHTGFSGSVICKKLNGVAARSQTPVLFIDVELGVYPRTIMPDQGRADGKFFGKKERLEIVDMERNYWRPQPCLKVLFVRHSATPAELLGCFFEQERIPSMPHYSHRVSLIETDATFDLNINRFR
jgi:hypothetical protein